MVRMSRAVPVLLALALSLPVTGCGWRFGGSAPPPPSGETAPKGLVPVSGDWEAGKNANLRAAPTTSAAVVGRLSLGQPVKVLGRVPNTDWFALQAAGGMAYVRLDLLELRGTNQSSPRGTTTVMPKPVDNDGPAMKAAPRTKVQAAPIKGTAIQATPIQAAPVPDPAAANPS